MNIKKNLGLVLLATTVLGGTVASAAPRDPLMTTGEVTVQNGQIDPSTGVIDPENPTEILPELPNVVPNPNPEMGPLEISHGPALKFGVIKTSANEVTTMAAANTYTDSQGKEQNRGALLQFGDLRTDANGYNVSAKLSEQFSQGENQLNGSTITFINPYANTVSGATGLAPKFNESFTLSLGEAVTVATASTADRVGKGMWAVEYGSSKKTSEEDTTGSSIQLTVPGNTASAMIGGNYTAVIEWAISTIPNQKEEPITTVEDEGESQ